MTNLPNDTYYRGYRLSIFNEGEANMEIHIFSGPDHIDTVYAVATAKAQVDQWMDAP